MANPVGRPRTIESPEHMIERAEAYFELCRAEKRPYRICGLALALGLSSRKCLDDYEARPEYCDIVKRLRLIIEDGYEERLCGTTPTGAIFVLKNMGWTDQQQHTLQNPDGSNLVTRIEIVCVKADGTQA